MPETVLLPSGERWHDTDPRVFAEDWPTPTADTVTPDDLDGLRFDGHQLIVLVDGSLRPDLCDAAPSGLTFGTLPRDHPELDRIEERDPFVERATAWTGGVLLETAPGAIVGPVQVLHLRTAQEHTATTTRTLAVAAAGSGLTVTQHFATIGDADLLVDHTTELIAQDGATLRFDTVQETSKQARFLERVDARVGRDATVDQTHVGLGAKVSRSTSIVRLTAPGAHAGLDGLYLIGQDRRTDHWTRVDHAVPDCTSHELYKGVLADRARGAFTGNVLVRPDAQRTNAQQENRNLLLSRDALAASTPQLEIFADDVQCSHGSTVGQIDEEALFFLRSRGIGHDAARIMLTKAFAGEVVERLAAPSVRKAIMARIENWFSGRAA